ncbi:MAG: type VI secretion system-associated protein TagF [Polyangiaceae bacterium]|jgi:type VI secretion system protein ImpM|nr:type VI secretion system-associated protein TagF [Polyangiaceae bacterium]MBK8938462.1 type VI secretion system-associated protein TagF [Polyangiaceae bacterium]
MFWRKKKSSGPPVVGCFGKLPATGDFIRHNAGGEELASFDRWMGAAMDFAQRSLGQGFEPAYQRSVGLFIFRGDAKGEEEPNRGLVGAWAASGDNAGRLYPMVVFASYDYGQLVNLGAALPIALWRFLTSAYEIATQGRAWPVQTFVDRVARLEVPNIEDADGASATYRKWLADNSMKALWETGFGSDSSRFWVLSNVVESVEPFRGKELPQTGLALRMPIGAGDAYATAVWIDMVLRVSKWKHTLLNTFWTPQQTALIHLGPPHVGSLREVIAPTGSAEHVAELCGLPTADEKTARARLRTELDAAVAATEQPIAQFLKALD